MNWRDFAQDYLTFSKKERIALFCVLALVIGLTIPSFFTSKKGAGMAVQIDTALANSIDTAAKRHTAYKKSTPADEERLYYTPSKNTSYTEGELFRFDPNTLPAEGWAKLGLPQRTIKTLINYRNKGGHFYKPEDLQKIWGLPPSFYQRVAPYIDIETTTNNTNFLKTPYVKKEKKIEAVAVNTADTTALIALPGIGSKLAQRIINFRDKLGGFYSVDQVGETYGLPDSTFQQLKPYLQVHGDLKKLNLNTATKEDLKTHPYIRWNIANAIVAYRAQHGAFKNIEELKNIMLIDEATFEKMKNYFTL